MSTPVDFEILALVVSPQHRYDGRPTDGPKPAARPERVDTAELRAHRGVVGDRYFGTRHVFASVTMISIEAIEQLGLELGAGPFDPVLARRNVITRGLDVDALARTAFTLDLGDGPLRLRSLTPANPCAWMNQVYAPGAHRALRGHGGIRCEPLTDGTLRIGRAVLTEVEPITKTELDRRVTAAVTT